MLAVSDDLQSFCEITCVLAGMTLTVKVQAQTEAPLNTGTGQKACLKPARNEFGKLPNTPAGFPQRRPKAAAREGGGQRVLEPSRASFELV